MPWKWLRTIHPDEAWSMRSRCPRFAKCSPGAIVEAEGVQFECIKKNEMLCALPS